MNSFNHLLGSFLSTFKSHFSFPFAGNTDAKKLFRLIVFGLSAFPQAIMAQDPIPQENQCGENTLLITPCYVAGDPTNPLSSSRNDAAVVGFTYSSQTTQAPRPSDPPSPKSIIATGREVGAVWGIAHQRSSNLVFGASVLKRHAGFGPLGSGGIYVMEVDEDLGGGQVRQDLSFSLGSLQRANGNEPIQTAPLSLANNQSRDLPPEGFIDASDASAFDMVGKASLGDIDMTEDESSLWVINVYDQTLYEIPIENPMTTRPSVAIGHKVPDPQCGSDYRPWALKVKENKVYVGVVCTSASFAYVYVFNILTSTWEESPLITVDLDYERGNLLVGEAPREPRSANWNSWADTWAEMDPPDPSGSMKEREFGYAQPILSDIEFVDNGSMVLGFLDRGGMQLGNQAVSPDPSTGLALFTGDAAGDLLIACLNSEGNYILEKDGQLRCNTDNIEGNVPQSPGNGEFFTGDFFEPEEGFIFHDEIMLGSVAYLPGADEIVTVAYDPIDFNTLGREFDFGTDKDYVSKSGGAIWLSLEDGPEPGKKERGFMVYSVLDAFGVVDNTFGKAAGLGDLELFCSVQAPVVLCAVDPGTLVLAAEESDDCYDGTSPVNLSATKETDPTLPEGFQLAYLLSMGEEQVLIDSSSSPQFTVEDFGLYGIHTFIFHPDSVPDITFGVTTNEDIATVFTDSLCGVVDVTGVTYTIDSCFKDCVSSTGSLESKPFSNPAEACYDGENCVELAAEVLTEPILDTGYTVIYVLTSGEELTIRGTGPEPIFCIEDTGRFAIHTLVYNPDKLDLTGIVPGQTSGEEVLNLIAENDTCAQLDVTGAIFRIPLCDSSFCPNDVGELTPIPKSDPLEACYDMDNCVELAAEIAVEPIVLEGYSILYVLTQGEELIIQDTHTLPEFCVEGTGRFTIHTLVYDPDKLDLSNIMIGETTGSEVLELIAASDTCAKLDVSGAPFDIELCPIGVGCPDTIDISAGTLFPVVDSCYDSASGAAVKILAEHVEDPLIPPGFRSIYVLTEGDDLVISQTGAEPMFMVSGEGSFRIHTLIFDSLTLDLSGVELGTTTAGELLNSFADTICVALDIEGALFDIIPCPKDPCEDVIGIDAGTLSPITDTCYVAGEVTVLSAEHGNAPVVPEDFSLIYVLTRGEGLVVLDTDSTPTFKVQGTGLYTIHTLVYDSTSLDLDKIEFGNTTGSMILDMFRDSICAALDVEGATFRINPCSIEEECEDIRSYTLNSWGADRTSNADHALFLFHSPSDPQRADREDRKYGRFLWNTSGNFQVYLNEDGSIKDTATLTGRVYNVVEPGMEIEIDFQLINPMTWSEHKAMGGDYKANQNSQDVADTAHVNWTYWEISDESRLIGHGELEGLVFAVSHFPESKKFKLQVGYGANDKDGSWGMSGWFRYSGVFDGISYDAQGDVNLDIDTCITTEICEPIGGTTQSWVIRDVNANAVEGGDPRVNITWLAFSGNPQNTLYAVDKKIGNGRLYETIEILKAEKDTYLYRVEDRDVEAYSNYSYRLRVVVNGEAVGNTKDQQVKLDKILLELYPNPTDKTLQLAAKYPYAGRHLIEMLNVQGQRVDMHEITDLLVPYTLDVSGQPAGMYFLKVTTPDGKVKLMRFAKK